MLTKIRQLLDYKLTIAEFIGLAVILGVPYFIVGLLWSSTHTEHLHQLRGADLVVSFLGSIVSWPVLLFSNECMTRTATQPVRWANWIKLPQV
ncbi:MAG: hypothetical protein QOF15_842 [Mycobacterium sp.]|nr:hypothetical protein [Mycobacterium sp.]